jgi:hypothetical protein
MRIGLANSTAKPFERNVSGSFDSIQFNARCQGDKVQQPSRER